MLKLLPLLIACAMLSACAGATRNAPLRWDAEAAAQWREERVTLNDANGRPLAAISRERVRRLVDAQTKLESAASVRSVLQLVEGAEPNGYSYPGSDGRNYVVVTLGMFDLIGDDEAEAAALLGHELAHLALGHRRKREERESMRSAASTAAGIALTLARVPLGASAADVASTAIERAYSRDEEREADERGLGYMRAAGFDPAGAVRLWEKLAAKSPNDGALAFLSTHPASADRLEAMRAAIGPSAMSPK